MPAPASLVKPFTLLDGGMGRELERIGAPFKQPEWSALALIESPQSVTQAHSSYIKAGADIITTNAYALVPYHIGQERFDNDAPALAALAGQCAREAAERSGRAVKVAGCLPPIGGSYDPDSFSEEFSLSALKMLITAQEPYVDFWLVETISSVAEALCAVKALQAAQSQKPFWLSFNLQENMQETMEDRQEICLRSGEPVRFAVRTAIDTGAAALLYNCNLPDDITFGLRATQECAQREKLAIPYGAYANAFCKIAEKRKASSPLNIISFDLTPLEYNAYAKTWMELDATIIGGCCGIGPDHIKALDDLRHARNATAYS